MITRQYGNIVFICDDCEEEQVETGTNDFQEAVNILKETEVDGTSWAISNIDGEWRHTCPGCSLV